MTEFIEERAKLDFSFQDEESVKEKIKEKIEKISLEAGFIARANNGVLDKKDKFENDSVKLDRRIRTKTGRTYPFNTKIKPEVYSQIVNLSDALSEREGRYVSLAEVIERAIHNYNDEIN
jgi:hypothetical protein